MNTSSLIQPDDLPFILSPDAGHPLCICSRCHDPIPTHTIPIRIWLNNAKTEYRYHAACLNLHPTDHAYGPPQTRDPTS